MKHFHCLALCIALFTISTSFAGSPDTERIAQLVRDLGADSFDARETAQQALVDVGRDALPAVEAVLKDSSDPEVHNRAAAIIAAITRPRWERDIAVARAKAKASGKPLLVFSTVGEPDGWS